MKKILSLVLAVFVAGTAYADTCATSLAPPFTEAQANALCRKDGLSVAISQLPQTDATYSLGSATKQWLNGFFSSTVQSGGLLFPAANEEAVAGAGTTTSDAAVFSATKHIHQLTGANGTVGWKFPTADGVGSFEILLNTTAGVAKLYAQTGGTVNGGSTDAAFSALTGIKPILCYSTAALTWICS